MKRLLTLLNFSLAGVAVWYGIHFFQSQTDTESKNPRQMPVRDKKMSETDANQGRTAQQQLNYEAINTRNLFRVRVKRSAIAAAPTSAVSQANEKKQDAPLPYSLSGTVTGIEDTYAVIRNKKDRNQVLVKQGEEVGGLVVKDIQRKRIVLSANGKDQVLEMELLSEPEQQTAKPPSERAQGKQDKPEPSPPTHIILDRAEFDAALRDISAVKNKVNTRPHLTDGDNDGVVIYRLRPDSIYQTIGLQNGDVLWSINGVTVDSQEDIRQLPARIGSGEAVTVILRRQDDILELNYTIAE